jgi:transposase
MLRWIAPARSEALFYYFRLEDQVPENHLLRLIDKHISFEFVREQLKKLAQEPNCDYLQWA